MSDLASLDLLLVYSDRMNRIVFAAADRLPAQKLDAPIDISLGTLRRILGHILSGEQAWLSRWSGDVEAKWPKESETATPARTLADLEAVWAARAGFLKSVTAARLDQLQTYRDSRGSLFQATLREMILQGIVHSIHHRAQAVNAIRRLDGDAPEVDYMASVRRPA